MGKFFYRIKKENGGKIYYLYYIIIKFKIMHKSFLAKVLLPCNRSFGFICDFGLANMV
jgi:hypothetical protein